MTRDELLADVISQAEEDPRLLALLLGGSLGRGEGGDWSDLDMIAVVSPEDHPGFTAAARTWVERASPLIYWRQPFPGAPLFNAITPEWLRLDLTVTAPGRVSGARDAIKPLLDRAAVWASLPETLAPRAPEPARVEALVLEFIRILGLLPLGLGRGELAVSATGSGLQRAALISLLIEELGLPQPPGALHLSRLLSPEALRLVDDLPPIAATRESAIAFNQACAAAFLPRARRLMERVGAPWPEALEAAAHAHLRRELGDAWP